MIVSRWYASEAVGDLRLNSRRQLFNYGEGGASEHVWEISMVREWGRLAASPWGWNLRDSKLLL